MRKAGPPSSAKQSRDMMARILKQVEDQYAPPGSEKMTILELTHRMVVPYGSGGFFVPLIGGEIHINANGAAGLFDCYQSKYQLEIASASGAPFLAVLGFQYPFP
ncbi:MAG: hypothetical protein CMK71_11935 [Pseudomonadaceae bacterium]|nr:hypothetical protein [Pseudomonadaceae bacterium]